MSIVCYGSRGRRIGNANVGYATGLAVFTARAAAETGAGIGTGIRSGTVQELEEE